MSNYKQHLDIACMACSGVAFVIYCATNDQLWANIALFNGIVPLWGKSK